MTVDVPVKHLAKPVIRRQMLANGQGVVVGLLARARTTMAGHVKLSGSRVRAMQMQTASGSPIDRDGVFEKRNRCHQAHHTDL